jgi:hypothetical protein
MTMGSMMRVGDMLSLSGRPSHGIHPPGTIHLYVEELGFESELRRTVAMSLSHTTPTCYLPGTSLSSLLGAKAEAGHLVRKKIPGLVEIA